VDRLNHLNLERRRTLRVHFEELVESVGENIPAGLVAYRAMSPRGIAGLLASKCVERYSVPTTVLFPSTIPGQVVGSGRRGQYLIATHAISTSPSATVFDILRHRAEKGSADPLPYVGVAAWIKKSDSRTAIFRTISGPQRDQFDTLPESKKEVEAIAGSLPKPSTLVLGGDATETHFKNLPLDNYNVIHLALHGYVDEDYPDRSALVFAPQKEPIDDGLLQVREIRNLHLKCPIGHALRLQFRGWPGQRRWRGESCERIYRGRCKQCGVDALGT
jgi:hypothetical protein